jgi:hypothetical protein
VQDKTSDALNTLAKEVVTRNYFAPLRTAEMGTDAMPHEEAVSGKTGRPPPIVLTSTTNLIHLQKQVKGVLKDNFEFRTTRNGTRIITKTMADFSAFKFYLEKITLPISLFTPIFKAHKGRDMPPPSQYTGRRHMTDWSVWVLTLLV